MDLPDHIPDELTLDEMLSRPEKDLIEFIKNMDGDIMILGSAGKIGISLACMAARAIQGSGVNKRVIAVDIAFDDMARQAFDKYGVETIVCDLLDRTDISKLPVVTNVIFMVGKKFGTSDNQELTWAINVIAPNNVAHHFIDSNIVVFSSGCVYPLVPVDAAPAEDIAPWPVGEYSQSTLGRERVFSYYSKTFGTRICQYRLNYAIDMRYGVLYDIAMKVFNAKPVELAVSHFNCIWQGDANRLALLCLGQCASPPAVLNVTGPETISVRETAEKFARIFNKEVKFTDERENSTMYLSDASRSFEIFGKPVVTLDTMIKWQARWIEQGGRSLNKPTHFEVTSGKY